MHNHHRLQATDRKSQLEARAFLSVIFEANDLIELRLIESWKDAQGRIRSRPEGRTWMDRDAIVRHFPVMLERNTDSNVYFGVCPRSFRGGKKSDVELSRVVWIDLDGVSPDDAAKRWIEIGVPPSLVVSSGHGVHAYWRLCEPFSLIEPRDRVRFELIVKRFSEMLGGDTTYDCTRLLRLPGTWNVKNRRNGAMPVPCELLECSPNRVFAIDDFAAFLPTTTDTRSAHRETFSENGSCGIDTFSTASLGRSRDQRRIQGVLRYLARDVSDRSRRDFGALVLLIQAGLSKEEVYSLVMPYSKFSDAGDEYFERSFEAARKTIG